MALSNARAKALSTALFLIGLALLFFIDSWWPALMLVIGVPLALRQYLLGRKGDALISLAVFGGFFIIGTFDISWKILIPILFVMAALYTLCKEWVKEETNKDE